MWCSLHLDDCGNSLVSGTQHVLDAVLWPLGANGDIIFVPPFFSCVDPTFIKFLRTILLVNIREWTLSKRERHKTSWSIMPSACCRKLDPTPAPSVIFMMFYLYNTVVEFLFIVICPFCPQFAFSTYKICEFGERTLHEFKSMGWWHKRQYRMNPPMI